MNNVLGRIDLTSVDISAANWFEDQEMIDHLFTTLFQPIYTMRSLTKSYIMLIDNNLKPLYIELYDCPAYDFGKEPFLQFRFADN